MSSSTDLADTLIKQWPVLTGALLTTGFGALAWLVNRFFPIGKWILEKQRIIEELVAFRSEVKGDPKSGIPGMRAEFEQVRLVAQQSVAASNATLKELHDFISLMGLSEQSLKAAKQKVIATRMLGAVAMPSAMPPGRNENVDNGDTFAQARQHFEPSSSPDDSGKRRYREEQAQTTPGNLPPPARETSARFMKRVTSSPSWQWSGTPKDKPEPPPKPAGEGDDSGQ